MTNIDVQTVHGVTSPIVRCVVAENVSAVEEASAESPPEIAPLYRSETAERLEEQNKKAKA